MFVGRQPHDACSAEWQHGAFACCSYTPAEEESCWQECHVANAKMKCYIAEISLQEVRQMRVTHAGTASVRYGVVPASGVT